MSLFELPTSDRKYDSFVSSYRMDEVAPVSSVPPTGGGSVVFETHTPSAQYLIPNLCYMNVRFKITQDTSAGDATQRALPAASSNVAFNEYPASKIFSNFNHSINGQTLESLSDLETISAIKTRTQLPSEYFNTIGETFRLKTMGNQSTAAPAIEPFDGTVEVFDCAYIPPSSFFEIQHGVSGIRQRLTFTLASTLEKALLVADTALTTTITIDSIRLYLAHATPKANLTPPRRVVLSLPCVSVTKQSKTSNAATLTYSVAPSTDKIYIAAQSRTPDDGINLENASHQFKNDVKTVSCQYAGKLQPQIAYEASDSGNVNRASLRPYWDFATATGFLARSMGMPYYGISEWEARPIFGFVFEKQSNDASTALTVRIDSTSAATVAVAFHHHKLAVLEYGADGLCTNVVVQENLS